VLSGCTPLAVEWLKEQGPSVCSPISNTACYPEIDTGVILARYNACLVSWGSSPFQCSGWPTLGDGQQFVVLTVDDCSYDVTIENLEACADSIQIAYRVQGTCSSCDGKRSNFRVLVLPRDVRPVVAVSRGIVMPPVPSSSSSSVSRTVQTRPLPFTVSRPTLPCWSDGVSAANKHRPFTEMYSAEAVCLLAGVIAIL
jgi:hypothetical protein